MRWEDERYVRFYTRNTPEWLSLSWRARGLFGLLMREVDRAGILKVGKLGLRGVATALGAAWEELEEPLTELINDGCIRFDEAQQCVFIPNFIDAQECRSSDAARKKFSREMARAKLESEATASTCESPVTSGHQRSQNVLPSLDKPSLTKPTNTSATNVASELFEHWLKHRKLAGIGKRGRDPVFDNKRRSKITSALKQFPAEDVKKALAGIFYSEFHIGDNKDKKLYCDIDNALRDASHIEQFRDLYDKHHPPMPPVYKPEPAPTNVCDPPEGLSDIFDQ